MKDKNFTSYKHVKKYLKLTLKQKILKNNLEKFYKNIKLLLNKLYKTLLKNCIESSCINMHIDISNTCRHIFNAYTHSSNMYIDTSIN